MERKEGREKKDGKEGEDGRGGRITDRIGWG